MTASELIKRLQELVEEHGDLEVWNADEGEILGMDAPEDEDGKPIYFKLY